MSTRTLLRTPGRTQWATVTCSSKKSILAILVATPLCLMGCGTSSHGVSSSRATSSPALAETPTPNPLESKYPAFFRCLQSATGLLITAETSGQQPPFDNTSSDQANASGAARAGYLLFTLQQRLGYTQTLVRSDAERILTINCEGPYPHPYDANPDDGNPADAPFDSGKGNLGFGTEAPSATPTAAATSQPPMAQTAPTYIHFPAIPTPAGESAYRACFLSETGLAQNGANGGQVIYPDASSTAEYRAEYNSAANEINTDYKNWIDQYGTSLTITYMEHDLATDCASRFSPDLPTDQAISPADFQAAPG